MIHHTSLIFIVQRQKPVSGLSKTVVKLKHKNQSATSDCLSVVVEMVAVFQYVLDKSIVTRLVARPGGHRSTKLSPIDKL